MPYISESEYADYMHIKQAVSEIKPHVTAWIDLMTAYVESLPADIAPTAESEGSSDKSYAEHELRAMKRDLGALIR